ncbi:MAG: 3-deoxy-7-phosphoheptulonate synthase [Pseudomonadales bacterium]|nr:3-deoxy-7-phosphoheptulonate synthase [Pseudomonadales bacterium]
MQLENVNVEQHEVLTTPENLKAKLPAPEGVREFITSARATIEQIVTLRDQRLLVVVGPCSIHDPDAALEYADRLASLSNQVDDRLLLVMRAYFEKPRSTVGWKGLINDPYLNDSFKVAEGLEIARKLLLDISERGLPIATEALDPITPQYLQDLISWSAIGARTTESQTHREMASGLSCAVGFKNGTDGSLGVALNALQSATSPHSFLGISPSGQVSVIHTRGNPHTHVVLRGGSNGPNYAAEHVTAAEQALQEIEHTPSIMIDLSHANSGKDHRNQTVVLDAVIQQIRNGNHSITGLMIESNLQAGSQKLNGHDLEYGVSVTDACVGWEETEEMLRHLHREIAVRF